MADDIGTQHFNIGDNLRHKAFYVESIEELHKALHLQETKLGSNSAIVAMTHYSLGLAFRATKDYKQAMKHLNTATEIYESLGDRNKFGSEIKDCKLNQARTHHCRGVSYQRSGQYDDSIMEHRKAISIRESLLGRSHLETARSHYVMGCALSDRGDFDEALGELRRALRARILVFGKEHLDSVEVVDNIGTVLNARGNMNAEAIIEYKTIVFRSLDYETEGDIMCRKDEFEDAMIYYRKALSLEMQYLGDLHPTTCDLYLRMAEALGEFGDLQASLVEYKSAITIYERMMGKFHVKMANIYTKLAGVLMDKGEYETALSFYAKAYGIYDGTLGLHDDTKQALMNVKLAAEKNRAAKSSMAILVKAEEEFNERHPSVSGVETPDISESLSNEDGKDEMNTINGEGKKKRRKKKKKKKDEEDIEDDGIENESPEPTMDII